MWWLLAILAFGIVAVLSQGAKSEALRDYQDQQDDAKASLLVAEVRKELAAQKRDEAKGD